MQLFVDLAFQCFWTIYESFVWNNTIYATGTIVQNHTDMKNSHTSSIVNTIQYKCVSVFADKSWRQSVPHILPGGFSPDSREPGNLVRDHARSAVSEQSWDVRIFSKQRMTFTIQMTIAALLHLCKYCKTTLRHVEGCETRQGILSYMYSISRWNKSF